MFMQLTIDLFAIAKFLLYKASEIVINFICIIDLLFLLLWGLIVAIRE